MLLLALTATTLVSCDDDSDIAATLEGTWQGDMEVSTYLMDKTIRLCPQRFVSCKIRIPILQERAIGSTTTETLLGETIRWPTIFSGQCPMVSSMCTS